MVINLELFLSDSQLVKLEDFRSKRLRMARIIHDEETVELFEQATENEIVGYFLTSKLW